MLYSMAHRTAILVTSDGLWDVLEYDEALDLVKDIRSASQVWLAGSPLGISGSYGSCFFFCAVHEP